MSEDKEILKDLLIDENEAIKNLGEIVKKVKTVFRIESKSGKIVFTRFSELTNKQRISALLLAKYFAFKLNLTNTSSFSGPEISSEIGIIKTTLSKPLGQLVSDGFIKQDGDKYSISHHRIEEVVETLLMESDEK